MSTDKHEEMAREYAKAYRQYLATYIGQSFTEGDADRQNLGMALDHLEEAAGLLLHLASALRQVAQEKERDAQRYRWLRDMRSVAVDTTLHGNGCRTHTAQELDAAIDAAMALSPTPTEDVPTPTELVDGKHSSHETRSSDASTYDEVCIKCGATDVSGGGWGKLAEPCTANELPTTQELADVSTSGELIDRDQAIIATSVEVDFEKGTWTFEPKGQWSVRAGDYYLIPTQAAEKGE